MNRALRLTSITSCKRSLSFAREVSFKVQSVEQGKQIDAVLKKTLIPELQKIPGYKGSNRLLCGGKLDYKLITRWETLDSLKGSGEGMPDRIKKLAEAGKIPAEWVNTQNFMYEELA
jgi:hypothetical protein